MEQTITSSEPHETLSRTTKEKYLDMSPVKPVTGIVRMTPFQCFNALGNPLFDEGDMNRPELTTLRETSQSGRHHEQRQDWKTQRNTSHYKRSHVSLMLDLQISGSLPDSPTRTQKVHIQHNYLQSTQNWEV